MTLPIVTPIQRHRRAVLDAAGIGEVGAQEHPVGEKAARGCIHEKNKADQHGDGGQNQHPHLQLRPLNLFAAWHVTPLTEMSELTP